MSNGTDCVPAPQADDVAAPDWTAWKVVVADEASPKVLELPFADIDQPAGASSDQLDPVPAS